MARDKPISGSTLSPRDAKRFIEANTRLLAPPLVPELRLHLAEESLPIWQKTEDELEAVGLPPPYWAFAWAGGQALARYLIDTPDLVKGRSIFDIGAGSGLVALAAGRAGARRIIANDIDPFARQACRLNATANALDLEVCANDLLSGAHDTNAESDAFDPGPADAVDIVTLADVFYEEHLAHAATAFAAHHHRRGAAVLIGDPCRSYFPVKQFKKIAEFQVPVTRELEDSEIKSTAVWRFQE